MKKNNISYNFAIFIRFYHKMHKFNDKFICFMINNKLFMINNNKKKIYNGNL